MFRAQLNWELLGAVLTAVSGLVAVTVLDADDGVVLCPFRRCTGGYCPGCGSSRAVGRLLAGDVSGSWSQHPIIILGVMQASVLAVAWPLTGVSIARFWHRWGQTMVLANTGILIGLWAVRLATGAVPLPDTVQFPFSLG